MKGLTVKQWCDEKGISPKTYYNWKRHANIKAIDETEEIPANQAVETTPKQQWAVLSADGRDMQEENGNVNKTACYQITYGGFTINLTNDLKAGTLTEILKAVRQTCC